MKSGKQGWAVPIAPKPTPDVVIAVPLPAPAEGACDTPVMAFVPKQEWKETYEAETGLSRGTVFPCLDLPFIGEGACRR